MLGHASLSSFRGALEIQVNTRLARVEILRTSFKTGYNILDDS